MKRFIVGAAVALVVTLGLAPVALADTNNFTITNFDVKLELGRDSENRSTLKTTEIITADFPPNQNRGITRNFVKSYDGHSTSFQLLSVTDESDQPLEYNWSNDELRVGNKEVYVSGQKTYKITYSQRDVTKYYQNTDRNEFYWDAIGVEWRVPIKQASITLMLDESIVGDRQTDLNCYSGKSGQTKPCDTAVWTRDNPAATVSVGATNLLSNEGVTIALGFKPGAFAAYQQTLFEQILDWWLMAQAVLLVISIGLIIALSVRYMASIGRKKELQPVVPEYLPPSDTSITTSAAIVKKFGTAKGSVMAAQLIDLAVRHYVRLYETKSKTLLSRAKYEIEISRNPSDLLAEEQELLKDMFGRLPQAGDKLKLETLKNNSNYAVRTMDNDKKLTKLIQNSYALDEKNQRHESAFRKRAVIGLIFSILLLSPPLLIATLVAFSMSYGRVLTDKGLSLRRHLEGLKMYIGVAEEDRLRMLQSPEGASKVAKAGEAAGDQKSLVKLYERVLAYAVLFGQEKDWANQIGHYYEQIGSQPDWYTGTSAFNAATFAAGMSGLSATATSASDFSSLSGGSGGGGFSGGGGGGGGGSGW